MATATVLGTGTGTGRTLTIPLTVGQSASALVQVMGCAITGPDTTSWTTAITSVTDTTVGGSWQGIGAYTGIPLIGNAQSKLPVPDPPPGSPGQIAMNIDSMQRSGATLLTATDTVTVHWDPVPGMAPSESLGMVISWDGVDDLAVKQGGFYVYGDSDQNPENSGLSGSFLDWSGDFGESPTPDDACICIGLYASDGGGPFAPSASAVVADMFGSSLYLAVTMTTLGGGIAIEPGGTFGGSGSMCVGNYQFVAAAVSTGVGIHAWQRL